MASVENAGGWLTFCDIPRAPYHLVMWVPRGNERHRESHCKVGMGAKAKAVGDGDNQRLGHK